MALTLTSPTIEKKIREAAARKGVAAETYLLEVLRTALPDDKGNKDTESYYTAAEKKTALDHWASRFPTNAPLISDEALRRENL